MGFKTLSLGLGVRGFGSRVSGRDTGGGWGWGSKPELDPRVHTRMIIDCPRVRRQSNIVGLELLDIHGPQQLPPPPQPPPTLRCHEGWGRGRRRGAPEGAVAQEGRGDSSSSDFERLRCSRADLPPLLVHLNSGGWGLQFGVWSSFSCLLG